MTSPEIVLGGARIGAMVLGTLILTVGEKWLRRSKGVAPVGAALVVLGEALPRNGDRLTLILQIALAVALCVGVFLPRRIGRVLAIGGAVLVVGLEARTIWIEQGPGFILGMAGVVAVAVGLFWLMKLSDKLFPSPEARGAAEVLRLRAERRAGLRTGASQ